jgi:16S rRNA (cytosine967-C5)-methyltransferase
MAAYRGPRRGSPGRRGASGRAGPRRDDQGSASTSRTGADPSTTDHRGAGRPATGRPATGRSATGRPGTGRGNTGRGADLPRRTAYDVLAAVETRQSYANLLLPRLLAERGITGRDAALATELSYGTLRGLGTYDAVLAACSDRPLDKLDPPVLQVLRLGAHQLLATRA